MTLTVEQVDSLSQKLSMMRHDINGKLALIVAAVELIRHKPHLTEQMLASLESQPGKVTESMKAFSVDFEEALGITRP